MAAKPAKVMKIKPLVHPDAHVMFVWMTHPATDYDNAVKDFGKSKVEVLPAEGFDPSAEGLKGNKVFLSWAKYKHSVWVDEEEAEFIKNNFKGEAWEASGNLTPYKVA